MIAPRDKMRVVQAFCTQLAVAGGHDARKYLARRGFSSHTCEEYKIGYAPLRGNFLAQHHDLREAATSLGLLREGRNRELRDHFRDRIVFPYIQRDSTVLGFGGRGVSASVLPKYLYTSGMKRAGLFYGVDQAAALVHEHQAIYLVEGFFDVLALRQAAIPAIATGSAHTSRQQVGKLARAGAEVKVVLVPDNDLAGYRATLQTGMALAKRKRPSHICLLVGGKDPADILVTEGPLPLKMQASVTAHILQAAPSLIRRVQELEPKHSGDWEVSKWLGQYIDHFPPAKQEELREHVLAGETITPPEKQRPLTFARKNSRALKKNGRSFSHRFLEQVRSLPLSPEIAQHTDLQEQGKRKVGLCPAHSEKTPSFHVREREATTAHDFGFYCFGCGVCGRNIIDFRQRISHKGQSFVDTVLSIARDYSITPEYKGQAKRSCQKKNEVENENER